MDFLIKSDNVLIINTNRKEKPLDVYVDNHPLLFIWILAIPGLGLIIAIVYTLAFKNRSNGKIICDTINNGGF